MRATNDETRQARADTIVQTAREVAAAEGWSAVTTRRLSKMVGVSQPVLYSHFANMAEIQAQVALQGFVELRDDLHATTGSPVDRLHGICVAYLAFASRQPAVYDAMFSIVSILPFAVAETPPIMRASFEALVNAVAPFAAGQPEVLAEVLWSTLHGLVWLERTGRLGDAETERLDALVRMVAGFPRR